MQTQNIIRYKIEDRSKLYHAYMPFIKNGGIFYPTNKRYALGDEVFMILELPEDKTHHPIATRVVWLSTTNMPDRPMGIGLQFMDPVAGDKLKGLMEQLLSTVVSEKPTFTL